MYMCDVMAQQASPALYKHKYSCLALTFLIWYIYCLLHKYIDTITNKQIVTEHIQWFTRKLPIISIKQSLTK